MAERVVQEVDDFDDTMACIKNKSQAYEVLWWHSVVCIARCFGAVAEVGSKRKMVEQ